MANLTEQQKKVFNNLGVKNMREFKGLKRRQLRELESAFNAFNAGSTLCPGIYWQLDKIRKQLSQIEEKQSVQNWGR